MKLMLELMPVGFGGFIGSCLRFGLSRLANNFAVQFPMGTLLSNIIAGFFIGFIIGFENQTSALPPKAKLFLTTGLLGGLSTFSTFSLETFQLFTSGKYFLAAANIFLNLGLSLFGVFVGMGMAKMIFRTCI